MNIYKFIKKFSSQKARIFLKGKQVTVEKKRKPFNTKVKREMTKSSFYLRGERDESVELAVAITGELWMGLANDGRRQDL